MSIVFGVRHAGSNVLSLNGNEQEPIAILQADMPPDFITMPDNPALPEEYRNAKVAVTGAVMHTCPNGCGNQIIYYCVDVPGIIVTECGKCVQFLVCAIPEEIKPKNIDKVKERWLDQVRLQEYEQNGVGVNSPNLKQPGTT
jgi:hypothetical protein